MISFKLEKDDKGYHAWSPELPGCHTHGATRAEAVKNLKDAVGLYLDDLMEETLLPSSAADATPARKAAVRRRA